ncbi:uncharacterized protein LOC143463907 isoform X1 [Clavelina lepadiformis]|uniref:uncharacterized protein LOC143463907 isoform X1 n=2 Tax=Clavelina lepadiformis TaxID=159417 RepID=UPI004042992E
MTQTRLLIFLFALLSVSFWLTGITAGIQCWKCSQAKSKGQCLRRGRLVKCPDPQFMCQTQIRHGGWGGKPLIEKSCKKKDACVNDYLQNYRFSGGANGFKQQCYDAPPSSLCTCCCDKNKCNTKTWNCKPEDHICTALKSPDHGRMICHGNLMPTTTCYFSCNKGYELVGGSSLTECDINGNWTSPQPACRKIHCPRVLSTPGHGYMKCTRGMQPNTRCRFWCEEGYWLRGSHNIQCIQNNYKIENSLVWLGLQPHCRRIRCPKTFAPFYHGTYICTEDNMLGSQCSFQCDSDLNFKLNPPVDFIKCKPDRQWTFSPCCRLPCPPNAILDIVILLDSSASVGPDNFEIIKSFVLKFVVQFIVRDDAARFSLVLFNREIDTESQILLHDYPNHLKSILDGITEMSYKSSGADRTNTGKALNYAANFLLHPDNGNRNEAKDVLILITDSEPSDDVKKPAQVLHSKGVNVFLIPVQPPVGKLDILTLRPVVAEESHILGDTLTLGFDALDKTFSRKMIELLCTLPTCTNPYHNHETNIRVN